jgi:hypothetical protein
METPAQRHMGVQLAEYEAPLRLEDPTRTITAFRVCDYDLPGGGMAGALRLLTDRRWPVYGPPASSGFYEGSNDGGGAAGLAGCRSTRSVNAS